MSENKGVMESLTSLAIQVDSDDMVHSLTDANATWKFLTPIAFVDLVETYNDLVEETEEGLTSLKIQVDRDGQVHSFANANKKWTFVNPIAFVDVFETYNEVLENVVTEPKVLKNPLPKASHKRFFFRRS